jgi:hypothetical protein
MGLYFTQFAVIGLIFPTIFTLPCSIIMSNRQKYLIAYCRGNDRHKDITTLIANLTKDVTTIVELHEVTRFATS